MPKTTKRAVKKVNKKMTDKEFYEKLDALYYEPDSEATVEQVRNAGKWLGLEEPTNYWKYACITILLGIVTAMILSTPTIVSLFDACVQ